MDISLQSKVVIPDTVLARDLGNEIVLLQLEREEFIGLDDVGAKMWHALTEGGTIEVAWRRLCDVYDVDPEVLRADLLELIEQLHEAELVEVESSAD